MQKLKQLEDIKVMYVGMPGPPPQSAPRAFARLEKIVPLKGKRFYGVFHPQLNEYWACTKMELSDSHEELGLKKGTIKGGLYATEKLTGPYRKLVEKIAPTFEAMAKKYTEDSSRRRIEYYRGHEEFILYMPVLIYQQ